MIHINNKLFQCRPGILPVAKEKYFLTTFEKDLSTLSNFTERKNPKLWREIKIKY